MENCNCPEPGEIQKNIASDIEKIGWALQPVLADDDYPGFIYSIGMHYYGKPEIILLGVRLDHSIKIMSAACNQAIRSTDAYTHGMVVNVAKMPTVIRNVSDVQKKKHFYQAYYHYRHWDFSTVQLIWPDTKGKFPWETGFETCFLASQPLLEAVN